MAPQTFLLRTSRWSLARAWNSPSGRRLLSRLMPSLAHRRKKLPPLVQHPPGLFHRRHHLLDRFEDVLRAEVEAAIKALDRAINLLVGQDRKSTRLNSSHLG